MIGLDFETYGSRDLTKVGLRNYVDDPLFTPLVAVATPRFEMPVVFDFVSDGFEKTRDMLAEYLASQELIAAHNAGFELNVLRRIGIDIPASCFIDTAVVAAFYGAGRSLEAAASQLLDTPKYELGPQLIKQFCIPGPYQAENESLEFDSSIRWENPSDWQELINYCTIDAELSAQLAGKMFPKGKLFPNTEHRYSTLTLEMNQVGWPVDLDLVAVMQDRYDMNVAELHQHFISLTDDTELNLSSTQQMIGWCAKRGVRASSFDEERVDAMLATLTKKLESPTLTKVQREQYEEVLSLLQVKQALGGSSLKKLEVMARQTAEDGRLYDSYMHFGAQATGRTTGRGVQMQNLPRLFGEGDDVRQLFNPDVTWDNRTLAHNLRQVFRASHPQGQLIVGDFSSVESRGLAWQAGEHWKLDAYSAGQDLYKVLASKIYAVDYDSVNKLQRQVGKTGELSCGYGAGPGAVHAFAKGMGVNMTEAEAAALVREWRAANPAIVQWWSDLQDALLTAVTVGDAAVIRPWGYVTIDKIDTPSSLFKMGVPHSLRVSFVSPGGLFFTRYIHGVEQQGRNLTYYKPSERKTGDLWSNSFTDPKTKTTRQFTVYGGKLAGLLTQSLCREIFFSSLDTLSTALSQVPNARIIGQFHDEIVVEWEPGQADLEDVISLMDLAMSQTELKHFPLVADIKSAYRYIK